MERKKRLKQQVIKVENYGDDWINRLAVVLKVFDQMEQRERAATFRFLKGKYPNETHREHP